ncbi:HAD-IA family hydrolase [Auraticoccus sp. F435]|uniref:HAD-IA family hydrolase n=1 Tax=Auraticoccus cholistanensis TaxID=2656650 RepID=A0A6A9UWA5_9ACTN|nr:HAD family phosphatase [Auraticoccus cholistanensis]MVA75902.1 HAD-IA family hydrolase [Auraticoccus cholistanensis]
MNADTQTLPDAVTEPAPVLPAAALWDFDGTLVDSEPLWMKAQFELIPQWGGEWSDAHAHALVGNSLLTSGRYICDVVGRDDLTPEFVVDQLVQKVVVSLRTGEIDWRPGARELLAELAAAGIPSALVSASYRVLLEAVLERLPEGTFATVVAGDEVVHGKPHPEPYLVACERLGVRPEDTVVLEDSVPGCASGTAAGAVVLGVRNMVELPPAPRRVLLDTLAGVGLDELAAHVGRARASDPGAPA